MNPTPDLWVHEREAAELLAIKNSTIRTMRRDGRLTPGDHFIFATGTPGGPVTYNVTAIRQSMAERTKELVEAEAKRRNGLGLMLPKTSRLRGQFQPLWDQGHQARL